MMACKPHPPLRPAEIVMGTVFILPAWFAKKHEQMDGMRVRQVWVVN